MALDGFDAGSLEQTLAKQKAAHLRDVRHRQQNALSGLTGQLTCLLPMVTRYVRLWRMILVIARSISRG